MQSVEIFLDQALYVSYRDYHFPKGVIAFAVRLYFRFFLSLRRYCQLDVAGTKHRLKKLPSCGIRLLGERRGKVWQHSPFSRRKSLSPAGALRFDIGIVSAIHEKVGHRGASCHKR